MRLEPTRCGRLTAAMQSPFPDDIGDRVLRNDWVDAWHGRDAEVTARHDELSKQVRSATDAADVAIAAVRAGNSSGLIHGIEPAGDIVRRLVAEATTILRERPGPILGAIAQPATS